jgi:hypothetical protein
VVTGYNITRVGFWRRIVNHKLLRLVQGAHCEVQAVIGEFIDHFNNIISDCKFTSPGAQGDQHLREIRSDEVAWEKPMHCYFCRALAWPMVRTVGGSS